MRSEIATAGGATSSQSVSRAQPRVLIVGKYAFTYTICLLLSVVTIFPFFWMLSTSFKESSAALMWPPQFWPNPFVVGNYSNLFTHGDLFPFHRFIINSIIVSAASVSGRVFFASLGGYAFARMRIWGKQFAFSVLMAAFLMPPIVKLIPLYTAYQQIGWLDTFWPLIVPGMLSSSFGTFLMRQFFMTLPQELEDAAHIDGCGYFGVFWRIMLPLSKPAMAALAIFSFQSSWNDFYHPFIFINRMEMQTIQVGLRAFADEVSTDYNSLMAGSVLALLPPLVLYFSMQRYFVEGISMTGIKG